MTVRDTRSAILEAARAEVEATGTFAVKAVAARAGVTRQAIHYHFGDARGLRAALAESGVEASPDDGTPTRERLLAAGERVLARPGGGLATVEAIAAEAGLTKGAVYHHFADRAELLTAIAGRVTPLDEIVAALDAAEELPLREGLVGVARAYYRAMFARADLVRNLAANAARDEELGVVLMGEIIGRGAPRVFAWFSRRVRDGSLRPVDPSLVMQALFGPAFLRIVLGTATFQRLSQLGINVATANVEAYVDLLLGGIAGDPGAVDRREALQVEGG